MNKRTNCRLAMTTILSMVNPAVGQGGTNAAVHARSASYGGFGLRMLNHNMSPETGWHILSPFGLYDMLSQPMSQSAFSIDVVEIDDLTRRVDLSWYTTGGSPFYSPGTLLGDEVISAVYFFLGYTNADDTGDGAFTYPGFDHIISTEQTLTNSSGSVFEWDVNLTEFEDGFVGWAGFGGPDSTAFQITRFDLSVVFAVSELCLADYNHDGQLNFFDVSDFLSDYDAMDTRADLDSNDELNFFDVIHFITQYQQGCP